MPKLTQLNFLIAPELAQQLRELARQEGRSLSNLVAWIVKQYLNTRQLAGE